MKTFFIQELAKPMLRRVGTALAAWLLAEGIGQSQVDQIVLGLIASGTVAIDLLASHFARKVR